MAKIYFSNYLNSNFTLRTTQLYSRKKQQLCYFRGYFQTGKKKKKNSSKNLTCELEKFAGTFSAISSRI